MHAPSVDIARSRRAAVALGRRAADVQRLMAWGQLWHVVITAGLGELQPDWAAGLAAALRHPTA